MPEDKPLAARVREAVASGEYARAARIWNRYAGEVAAEVGSGRPARLQEMRELIDWTRATAACARALSLRRMAVRLTEARVAESYRSGASSSFTRTVSVAPPR